MKQTPTVLHNHAVFHVALFCGSSARVRADEQRDKYLRKVGLDRMLHVCAFKNKRGTLVKGAILYHVVSKIYRFYTKNICWGSFSQTLSIYKLKKYI